MRFMRCSSSAASGRSGFREIQAFSCFRLRSAPAVVSARSSSISSRACSRNVIAGTPGAEEGTGAGLAPRPSSASFGVVISCAREPYLVPGELVSGVSLDSVSVVFSVPVWPFSWV